MKMVDEPRIGSLRTASAFLDSDATMDMRVSYVVVSAREFDRIRMRKDLMMTDNHMRMMAGEALVAGVLFLTPEAALRRFDTRDLHRALDERIK
jgi:hypothetical protein